MPIVARITLFIKYRKCKYNNNSHVVKIVVKNKNEDNNFYKKKM